ncbi:MAG: hypothetical protein HN921_11450 [Bacteroidetes bacterium]|nr:hypothetical protein [Cytophagia bacterium]MBT6837148.1 hypothetical protein [Bacteroidota bacterium]MBT7040445.1 hypothetical protein [Bacteroidota bacterium]
MKNYLAFVLILFLFSPSHAQTADSFFIPPPVISVKLLNLVYLDIDNPISIAVMGVLPEHIIAESSIGILKGEKGEYSLHIKDDGQVFSKVEIKVYVTTANNIKYVCSKYFRIRPIPKPTIYFGSTYPYSGEIRIRNFVALRLENFPFDLSFMVDKFEFIYQPKNGFASIYKSKSHMLTDEMKKSFDNPKRGDKYIIANVWYSAPGLPSRLIREPHIIEVR